ncbi:MAG: hypothetical protein ACP5HX_10950 [Thermoproteota archaeon]
MNNIVSGLKSTVSTSLNENFLIAFNNSAFLIPEGGEDKKLIAD